MQINSYPGFHWDLQASALQHESSVPASRLSGYPRTLDRLDGPALLPHAFATHVSSEEDRKCVSASPLKQQHGVETSPPGPHPPTSSPASRKDHTSSISVRSWPWPCSKNDLPQFDSRASCRLRQPERLHLLACARSGQGITSVAVRKALVLRALNDKESKRAVDIRLALLFNFTFPALHILQSYCSAYRANGQAPSTALGSSCALIQP